MKFAVSQDVSQFRISPTEFLASRPDVHNIIAGTLVFISIRSPSSPAQSHQVLLLQRAASDDFPLQWEVPAGTADPAVDQSIIEVAARELTEETGLRASKFHTAVVLGPSLDAGNDTSAGTLTDAGMDAEYPLCLLRVAGLTWAIATFLVDVEDEAAPISLQASEHVRYAWLTEDEVHSRQLRGPQGTKLEFVSEAMRKIILEGFRLKNQL